MRFENHQSFSGRPAVVLSFGRSEEHTSELQSQSNLVCRLLLEKKTEERSRLQNKQVPVLFGVDIRIVDEHGRDLPSNGKAFRDLKVRGPWVITRYFKAEGGDPL